MMMGTRGGANNVVGRNAAAPTKKMKFHIGKDKRVVRTRGNLIAFTRG